MAELLRRWSGAQFTATCDAIREAPANPLDQWRFAVGAHARYTAENYRECFLANSELRYLDPINRKRVVESRNAQEELFRQVVESGIVSGDISSSQSSTRIVTAVLGMCGAITIWYRPDGLMSPDEIGATYAEFATAMLTVGIRH